MYVFLNSHILIQDFSPEYEIQFYLINLND